MNIKELASIAQEIIDCGGVGEIPSNHITLIYGLLGNRRESPPLHTLAVSLAAAIAHGYYVSPLALEYVRDSLTRDGASYLYFEGIRVAHGETKAHQYIENIPVHCNELLGRGVVVDGTTFHAPTLKDGAPAPFLVAAAKSLYRVLRSPDQGVTACVFESKGPLGKSRVFAASPKGVWANSITGTPESDEASAYALTTNLKASGWKEVSTPQSYAELSQLMETLPLSGEEFLQEMQLEWLA